MQIMKANPTDHLILTAVLNEADAMMAKLQQRQADMIANSIGKLFKK